MQRASASLTVSRSASRISWSRAPRLRSFEIVIRSTDGPGSSSFSLPDATSQTSAPLLKDHQRVAFRDRLALRDADLAHLAVVLRLDGHLHLHRLEDHERVPFLDLLANLALDLPNRAGDVRLDLWQRVLRRSIRWLFGQDH